MFNTKPEMRVIFTVLLVLFALFLAAPLVMLFIRSIQSDSGLTVANYTSLVMNPELVQSFLNSVNVSLTTAVITTVLGCLLAYTVHFTNLFRPLKGVLRIAVIMPMLLPTITYGFAIMYSFGNQGLMTQLFGQFFSIYGFNGVLLGYVIYTLPPVFLLIHNAFGYLDKRFVIVSQLMGDKPLRTFMTTTVRPLAGALGGAFVLSFILSFTDFGIPASIGGTYPLLPTQLYTIMLGAIPDLNRGAAVAIIMLIPSVLAMWLMRKLEKLNFSYDSLNPIELPRSRVRDIVFGIVSYAVVISMVATFLIIFIAPWLGNYPYDTSFTLKHLMDVLNSSDLVSVYRNSLVMALCTAVFGTIICYLAALMNVRTTLKGRSSLDMISMVTNTVPGMVLGIAYLLLFNTTPLKGTIALLVFCTIIHFFTTPYLMAKNSLSKMNMGWERTGELLGDSWFKTVRRVLLPNSTSTSFEMFSYLFMNSMVTVSGVIFIVSAHTALVASKIKELQHFAKFNEIFVLSMLIFFTNLIVKLVCDYLQRRTARGK